MIKEAIQGIIDSQFLSGAFLLSIMAGVILALMEVVKKLYERIRRRLVYMVRIEQLDELFLFMERWLKAHHNKEYRNVIASLQEIHISYAYEPRNEGESVSLKREEVKYRQENDTIFIKYKGVYVKIFKGREKLENANSLASLYFDSFEISTFFYKSKILQLIEEVIDYNQRFKTEQNKREIFTWDGYHNWNNLYDVKMKSFDQVIISERKKEDLKKDIDLFMQREKWYLEKAIPYKRGYLFYGSPGNGKTSLSVAIAEYLNRSIHTVTISEITDDGSMRSVFSRVKSNSVLLFEDVDTMFDKRKSKNRLSFSTFLNCLDGVFYKHGLIVIMTTNHAEKLDPALIRPGRIDFKMEIINPQFDEVKSYMELFYDCPLDIRKNGYDARYPMSEIQNICMSGEMQPTITEIFAK